MPWLKIIIVDPRKRNVACEVVEERGSKGDKGRKRIGVARGRADTGRLRGGDVIPRENFHGEK